MTNHRNVQWYSNIAPASGIGSRFVLEESLECLAARRYSTGHCLLNRGIANRV